MDEREYEPSERTAARAAELWKRMMRNPKFDNMGDTGTPQERMTMGMAGAMASMIPNNVTEERLDKFAENLKRAILDPNIARFERGTLSVDYGPDRLLEGAATLAGLKCAFPWKTTMWVRANHVSVSNGYGAEPVYHYPLKDGRWLVTRLSGSDILEIIEFCETGNSPVFTVEG